MQLFYDLKEMCFSCCTVTFCLWLIFIFARGSSMSIPLPAFTKPVNYNIVELFHSSSSRSQHEQYPIPHLSLYVSGCEKSPIETWKCRCSPRYINLMTVTPLISLHSLLTYQFTLTKQLLNKACQISTLKNNLSFVLQIILTGHHLCKMTFWWVQMKVMDW